MASNNYVYHGSQLYWIVFDDIVEFAAEDKLLYYCKNSYLQLATSTMAKCK